MEALIDENGKQIELGDLVKQASAELIRERRIETSGLIKNFLVKIEQVTLQIKTKKEELSKLEKALEDTVAKVKRLREGDWTVLPENNSKSKPDSSQKQEGNE